MIAAGRRGLYARCCPAALCRACLPHIALALLLICASALHSEAVGLTVHDVCPGIHPDINAMPQARHPCEIVWSEPESATSQPTAGSPGSAPFGSDDFSLPEVLDHIHYPAQRIDRRKVCACWCRTAKPSAGLLLRQTMSWVANTFPVHMSPPADVVPTLSWSGPC